MKVKVFSSVLATDENPAGAGVIDLTSAEGIRIFGGQDVANQYMNEAKIVNEITRKKRADAIENLIARKELPDNYKDTNFLRESPLS